MSEWGAKLESLSGPQTSALLAGYSMGYIRGLQIGTRQDLVACMKDMMDNSPFFEGYSELQRLGAAQALVAEAMADEPDGT